MFKGVMGSMWCFFLFSLMRKGLTVASDDAPPVKTDDGPIQGRRGGGLTTYHGVPFAAPPVGKLRWKPPQRPTAWTTVKKTVERGPVCPQFDIIRGIHVGDEDCLFLSIYVPDRCSVEDPCPVMQWIYGGAWVLGDNYEFGEYDGTWLANTYGVIIVAGNYRLDALGWLAIRDMEEESADRSFGNYGLSDQRAAMQWTQRNIRAFGGDPDKVTIFGESAGAYSVCQHTVSPLSNHLFSHAITESGDCDGPWMIFDGEDAKMFGDRYAAAAGCPAGDMRMSCLRQLPLKDVMEPYVSWFCPNHDTPAGELLRRLRSKAGISGDDPWCNKTRAARYGSEQNASLIDWRRWPSPVPPFAPVIGFAAVVDGSERGLPDVPLRLIKQGKVNRSPKGAAISIMMGTNHDELALFVIALPLILPSATLPVKDADIFNIFELVVTYHNHWNSTTLQQALAQYPRKDYWTNAERLVTLGTDFCLRCGTRDSVRAFSAAGVNAYLYSFNYRSSSYKSPGSLRCELEDEVGCGVMHGDELGYVFGRHKRGRDAEMSSIIGQYWTTFARHGSPNGDGVPMAWPRYNATSDQHLELALPVSVGAGLAKANCDFWDSLPKQGQYPSSAPPGEQVVTI